jgi:hypothetical protein
LALLMLFRGTVGLLSYAGLGLAPALVHKLTRPIAVLPAEAPPVDPVIDYASPGSERVPLQSDTLFTTAVALMLIMVLIGGGVSQIYAQNVGLIHGLGGKSARIGQNVAT